MSNSSAGLWDSTSDFFFKKQPQNHQYPRLSSSLYKRQSFIKIAMNYEEEYGNAVRVVESAVEKIGNCQYRVERAKQDIRDKEARSNATQRKARNFLEREKRILDQAYDSRDSAIRGCRRSYDAFRASKWAKQWGLPQELADEVAYWVVRR